MVRNADALPMRLHVFTLANASRQELEQAASSVFELFVQREAEFGVHPSVVIHYADLTDASPHGFLADAAPHVAGLAETAADEGDPIGRVVVLATYAHLVAPSCARAGYRAEARSPQLALELMR